MAMEFLSSINVCSIVSGVTVCGGTKVCSPIIAGTTCVTSPIICGTSCVKAPILQLTSVSAKSTETAAAFFNSAGCLLSGTSTGGGMTWSGSTANGVGTYVNATCICSQPNMTFDGSILCLAGNVAFNCASARCITMGNITTGTPYDLNICSESLYCTSGAATAISNVVLQSGNASGTTDVCAGGICLIAGNSRTTGLLRNVWGGNIQLQAGCGCGVTPDGGMEGTGMRGGCVTICGGGAVTLTGSSTAGYVYIQGGNVGGTCASSTGGGVSLYGGNSSAGQGGTVFIQGGAGATAAQQGIITLITASAINLISTACLHGNLCLSNLAARCITMGTTLGNSFALNICGNSICHTSAGASTAGGANMCAGNATGLTCAQGGPMALIAGNACITSNPATTVSIGGSFTVNAGGAYGLCGQTPDRYVEAGYITITAGKGCVLSGGTKGGDVTIYGGCGVGTTSTTCGGQVCVVGGAGWGCGGNVQFWGGRADCLCDGGSACFIGGCSKLKCGGGIYFLGGVGSCTGSTGGNILFNAGCGCCGAKGGNVCIQAGCSTTAASNGCVFITGLPAKSTETCVLYINSVGKISSGTTSGGIAWAGTTANGVGTYVSATCACSQPNMTFDGSSLGLTGNIVFTKGVPRNICWDADASAGNNGSSIIICGNNGAATKNGGHIQLCAGQGGTTPSIGGHVILEAGGGVTCGGQVYICGGAGATTGCITMLHSAVEVFKTIPTGVQVLCNFAMTTGAARSICFDTASAGVGSALSIIGNTGLACAGSAVACKGGAICIIGGAGGANSGTGCGGTGSTVYICGGTAGAGTGTTKAGFGGNLCLSAGQSTSTSSNKEGIIYLGSDMRFTTPSWSSYPRTISFVTGGATGCLLQILGQQGSGTGGAVFIQGGYGGSTGGALCLLGGGGGTTGGAVCIEPGVGSNTQIFGGDGAAAGGNIYLCTYNASSAILGLSVIADSCVNLYFCGVQRVKTLLAGVCTCCVLDVAGVAAGVGLCVRAGCGAALDWAATSDCRLKTDIAPISNALSIVTHLQGVRYHWCDDITCECHLGLIAQDVQKVLPEIVSHSAPSEEDGKYGITDDKLGLKYDKLTAILVEAIKEQQKQIHCLCLDLNYIRNEYYKNTK